LFSYSDVSNSMSSYNVKAKLNYITKEWRNYVYLQYRSADNVSFNNEIYDLGFCIEYRVKKLGIRLQGENLLHLNKSEWVDISTTSYYSSTYTYNTMPGNLLLGLTYHF
jgi:hypothetical protein